MEGKSIHKIPHKRPGKKKPKDKPKRPLSAYNFFFKEEREKILKVVLAEDPSAVQDDKEADDYLDEDAIAKLKKEGGKVSFEEMGKVIGQRWKNIDPDRLGKFSELAAEDTERYKKEMTSYNARQESRMRAEALKPPTVYPGAAAMVHGIGYPSQGMMPGMDPSRGGYEQYNQAMAGYYGGGMDFQGYGYAGMGYGGGYGMQQQGQGGQGGGMDPYSAYGMMAAGGGGYPQQGIMGYGGSPGGHPQDFGPGSHGDPQQAQSSPGGGGGPPPQGMYPNVASHPGANWGGQ